MLYPQQIPLNARKQIFQTIGWGIFLICITKTFMQKHPDFLQPLDFVWIVLAVGYVVNGVKVSMKLGSLKLIDLSYYPTRVMFVVYSVLTLVILAFAFIYHNYYQDMLVTSPYDYHYN